MASHSSGRLSNVPGSHTMIIHLLTPPLRHWAPHSSLQRGYTSNHCSQRSHPSGREQSKLSLTSPVVGLSRTSHVSFLGIFAPILTWLLGHYRQYSGG